MIKLTASLSDWGRESFAQTLKAEVEGLSKGTLPLEKATTQGGYVDESNISATVFDFADKGNHVQAKVGVFFNEIVGGCSCGDDPIVVNAYCEILVSIDKKTAEAGFSFIRG